MDLLAQIVAWLNMASNAAGKLLLAPVAVLPGWLSSTIFAALLGLAALVVFKYTSHQGAIRRVRDDIAAHLLALKLFPDSLVVTLGALGRILRAALGLLVLSLVPMLVMIVPMALILAQLDQWYHYRPLRPGEEAVVTLQLAGDASAAWPDVKLTPPAAAKVLLGPVRIHSRRELCWTIQARENGCHRLQFEVGQEAVDKELAVGEGFMRTSVERPGWAWSDILCQPVERPFQRGAAVQSIRIDYPRRISWTSGADWWLVYCFAASMFFACCFRPWLKVNV